MNKKVLVKDIIFLCASLFSFVLSLVYFIQSKSVWDDGYGVDYSFNKDYLVAMLISFLFVLYSAYGLYSTIKNQKNAIPSIYLTGTATGIVSFYTLGVFFKAVGKAYAEAKENNLPFTFNFDSKKAYLYIGILLLLVTTYLVADYFSKKNN